MTRVGMTLSSAWRVRQHFAEVVVTHELNRLRGQRIDNDRVAQGAELGLALDTVAGHITRFDVTGVATQFHDAFLDFSLQHSREALHADLFEMGLTAPLPVEL